MVDGHDVGGDAGSAPAIPSAAATVPGSDVVGVTVGDSEGTSWPIDPHMLTAVTIDVCSLKNGLNFSNPLLTALSANLGPTVLRIGGSDQNDFTFNASDDGPMKPCECGKPCVMTAAYWASINRFASRTGMKLVYGLAPVGASNAIELVAHTAQQGYGSVYAYSYGNEQIGDDALAEKYLTDMTQIRAALERAYKGSPTPRPLLVGADTGVGPRRGTTPADFWKDEYILQHLDWVRTFVSKCHGVVDAVTWHTYDYRASEIGTSDHHPLPWPPAGVANVTKLWDPAYLGVAGRLADNVTDAVRSSGGGHLPVWLSETNSVCHGGVANDTNAFANTLWFVNRIGLMSTRAATLMARQTLIGNSYALLGNFPSELIIAAPDYFTTALFRQLVGAAAVPAGSVHPRLPVYAYCGRNGGLVLSLVSLNDTDPMQAGVPEALQGGRRLDYVLEPHWTGDVTAPPADRVTSRTAALNGDALGVGPEGELPAMAGRPVAGSGKAVVVVPPLSVVFASFPDAQWPGCDGRR